VANEQPTIGGEVIGWDSVVVGAGGGEKVGWKRVDMTGLDEH